jgi:hypothetical protein
MNSQKQNAAPTAMGNGIVDIKADSLQSNNTPKKSICTTPFYWDSQSNSVEPIANLGAWVTA